MDLMRAYLDHAATTAMRPAARDAFVAASDILGNPTSVHTSGRRSRAVLDDALSTIAELLKVPRSWLIMTSGGTEADNLALRGAAHAHALKDPARTTVLVGGTEHPAIFDTAQSLPAPLRSEVLPTRSDGLVDRAAFTQRLEQDDVVMVSVMLVNNETGAWEDLDELGRIAHQHGALVHTDAVQATTHVPYPSWENVDLLTLAAHKIGGPVGVGALVVKPEVSITSVTTGGGQQRGVRSGTLDAPLTAAFAAALREGLAYQEEEQQRLADLAGKLRRGIAQIDPEAHFTLSPDDRQSGHIVHVGFPGADAESLLFLLDQRGVDASAGSACHAGVTQGSHVLHAMGVHPDLQRGALRLSLGWTSTDADVERLLAALPEALEKSRAVAALTRGGRR